MDVLSDTGHAQSDAASSPSGTRMVGVQQLTVLMAHVRECRVCQSLPSSALLTRETSFGVSSVMRLPCGFSWSLQAALAIPAIIRSDSLFALAQGHLLQGTAPLETLIAQYGTDGQAAEREPPPAVSEEVLTASGARAAVIDLPALPAGAPPVAGVDGSDDIFPMVHTAVVSPLAAQLAMVQYLAGQEASRTLFALYEVTGAPPPASLAPTHSPVGLLVARAFVLASLECYRYSMERARDAATEAVVTMGSTLAGGPVVDSDPLAAGALMSPQDHAHAAADSPSAHPRRSRFRGVYKFKNKDRWYATISVNNSLKYLGQFESEVLAAQAYDRAALENRGPKAQLNFRSGVLSLGAAGVHPECTSVGIGDIPEVVTGVLYAGRAQYVSCVMAALGLQSGESSRARAFDSVPSDDASPAPRRRRRTRNESSRLQRRASKSGLIVQPALVMEAAPCPPGVRRCGICRQPGHKVQTCPTAKRQLQEQTGSGQYVVEGDTEVDGDDGAVVQAPSELNDSVAAPDMHLPVPPADVRVKRPRQERV